ncbi:MAG: uroporphyrinogen-III C-methyltransferase [Candidatus Omnitrophica bacterium]|nr:uroporphyrinogen-III C-methyltransferase [Candidatus Omnitrophota bacterium]
MRENRKAKVFLVGVGPGNEQLVTQAALDCIKIADIIIYDHLISKSLLDNKKPKAKVIFAGKFPGLHNVPQQSINMLLLKYAKNDNIVVRLKGGDPFLFGRGSEEALVLKKAKIPFEIVPGVSSGFAVAAYSGIPLTHRGIASHVTFVTGHEDPTKKESSVDWEKIAALEGTIVVFMGMARLKNIIDLLLKYGKAKNTPVCITQWGTLPAQRSVTGSLDNIVSRVKASGITHPAIIIIGNVVNLRKQLNWFEKKPLFGKKILITRPLDLAKELSQELEANGAQTITYPLIEVFKEKRLKDARVIEKIKQADWILFTSRNAVQICFDILDKQGQDIRIFNDIKFAVLGSQTQNMLRARGIIADLVPKQFYMESLIKEFKKIKIAGQRIFIPHSRQGRPILVEQLAKQGAIIDELFVYHVEAPKSANKQNFVKLLKQENFDIITLTSSSCVHQFMRLADKDKQLIKNQVFAVIGPITRKTLENYGFKAAIEAKVYTASGLVQAIQQTKGGNK